MITPIQASILMVTLVLLVHLAIFLVNKDGRK